MLQFNIGLTPQSYYCRFNPCLLKDPDFERFIEAKMEGVFFMPNDNGKFSDSVLWDKAVVRGHKIIEKQRHFDLGDKPET